MGRACVAVLRAQDFSRAMQGEHTRDRRPCKSLHKFVLKEVISNLNVKPNWFPLPGGPLFHGVYGATVVLRG